MYVSDIVCDEVCIGIVCMRVNAYVFACTIYATYLCSIVYVYIVLCMCANLSFVYMTCVFLTKNSSCSWRTVGCGNAFVSLCTRKPGHEMWRYRP